MLLVFVDAETAEAVGVCEFAEALELIEGGGRVEFVGDFEKCHEEIIAAGTGAGVRTTAADIQQSTACSLQPTAYSLQPTAYSLLPTAYCLLPTAYCLLPTAYCLLPTAYCLLPTAYCKADPSPAKSAGSG